MNSGRADDRQPRRLAAHAAMLRDQGIIGAEDAAAILAGLDTIAAEYERDGVPRTSRSRTSTWRWSRLPS
jgi:argininosuccinate lyase